MNNLKKVLTGYKLLLVFLILIGTFFRFYKPELYVFGFDQVQILTNAEQIAQGNLTLIGPRTGPADMFTGPLVYYISAFFILFVGSPWAVVGMSVVIAFVTGVFLFVLAKKYLNEKAAVFMTFIWALSPFLIHFDRIAWNPNLSVLASALTFFPLLGIIKQKKVQNVDLLYIFIGSFLGFQAHFSGLLLPFMVLVTILVFKKFKLKTVLASGLGLFSSILPTLLFDARNGWLNTKGLINFVSEKESVGGTLFYGRFVHSVKTAFEILGSLIPVQVERQVAIYLGLLLFTVLLWQLFKRRIKQTQSVFLSLVWVVSITVLFSLYRSNSPEYYFFIFIPALLVLLSKLIEQFFEKRLFTKDLAMIVVIVLSLYTVSNFTSVGGKNSLRIGNQLSMAQDISRYNQVTPLSKIAYDILEVDSLGMRYFNEKYVSLSDTGKTVHISELQNQNSHYGNYGLWVDPRTDKNANYLISNNIVLKTPPFISILENKYLGDNFGSFDTFQVVANQELSSDYLIVVEKIDNPFITGNGVYKELTQANGVVVLGTDWKSISSGSFSGFIKQYENFALVYVSDKTAEEFSPFATEIEAIDITPKKL